MPTTTVPSFKAPDIYAPYPQQPAVAALIAYGYTQPMQNLDQDKPAKIRQEAQEAVYRAQREYRQAHYALVAFIALVVAAVAVVVLAL
jgi:hypothetical protein